MAGVLNCRGTEDEMKAYTQDIPKDLQEIQKRASGCASSTGSVDRLKQYVTSSWVEAEAICVDTQYRGPAEVVMIFKARDMLRDVLHVLNSSPRRNRRAMLEARAMLSPARGSAATYELWKHMADTHDLHLLESEIWDIVSYAKKLLAGMETTERKTFCAVCGGKIHKRIRRGETIWTHTVPKGQRKMPRCKTPTPQNSD